jgi:hypothetical protein
MRSAVLGLLTACCAVLRCCLYVLLLLRFSQGGESKSGRMQTTGEEGDVM